MRSPTTDIPRSPTTLDGGNDVYQPLHQNDMAQVGHDRILDLYATAAELRAARRQGTDHAGLVERTRAFLGRRLISIGTSVSGQGA